MSWKSNIVRVNIMNMVHETMLTWAKFKNIDMTKDISNITNAPVYAYCAHVAYV